MESSLNTTDAWNASMMSTATGTSNITNNTYKLSLMIGHGIMSKEEYDLANFIIYQILTPLVCVAGIVGNIISVIVINKTKSPQAFSKYLITLTITDILLLISGLARFSCSVAATMTRALASQIQAYCDLIVSHGFGYTSMNLSSSMIVVMSIERLVAVTFPFMMKRFVLEIHPKYTISAVLIIQLILSLPSVIWTEVAASTAYSQTNTTIYYVNYRDWALDLQFRKYFSLFLIVFNMILPVVAVTLSNIVILIILKRRKNTIASNSRSTTDRSAEERRVTVTLVAISSFYLVSVLPRLTIFIMSVALPNFLAIRRSEDYLFDTVQDASVLVVCLNGAIDFFIYIMTSSEFREMFKKCFVFWRSEDSGQTRWNKHFNHNNSTSSGLETLLWTVTCSN